MGYGRIHKIFISRMIDIPTIVDFIWKKSKAALKKEEQVEWLVEASVCPILHLRVIIFWVIHFQPMEVFALWWNGGSAKKFQQTNSLMLEAIKNQYILIESHMTMVKLKKILAFCLKHSKLSLSLIMIMDCVYKSKIIIIPCTSLEVLYTPLVA